MPYNISTNYTPIGKSKLVKRLLANGLWLSSVYSFHFNRGPKTWAYVQHQLRLAWPCILLHWINFVAHCSSLIHFYRFAQIFLKLSGTVLLFVDKRPLTIKLKETSTPSPFYLLGTLLYFVPLYWSFVFPFLYFYASFAFSLYPSASSFCHGQMIILRPLILHLPFYISSPSYISPHLSLPSPHHFLLISITCLLNFLPLHTCNSVIFLPLLPAYNYHAYSFTFPFGTDFCF